MTLAIESESVPSPPISADIGDVKLKEFGSISGLIYVIFSWNVKEYFLASVTDTSTNCIALSNRRKKKQISKPYSVSFVALGSLRKPVKYHRCTCSGQWKESHHLTLVMT